MTKQPALTLTQELEIAREWKQEDHRTQQEIAFEYGVSTVTIRRALAEQGLMELVGYKTRNDTALMTFLEAQGLRDLPALKEFIIKARTGRNAK